MVNVYNNYLHLQSEAGHANGEVLEGLSQEQAPLAPVCVRHDPGRWRGRR